MQNSAATCMAGNVLGAILGFCDTEGRYLQCHDLRSRVGRAHADISGCAGAERAQQEGHCCKARQNAPARKRQVFVYLVYG